MVELEKSFNVRGGAIRLMEVTKQKEKSLAFYKILYKTLVDR
jgi:hypothetical protein